MTEVFLTQYSGKIVGPVAKLLGYLMNWIFELLNVFGIPNVGLSIILFTILIYLLLLPLTIKQQKFSKLQSKMNPEIQAIQAKYKGKTDNNSMLAQQEEIKAVYGKYGVSQTGSCLQLIIQMPILFALYRVIYSIPAYVTRIGDTFGVLADKIISTDGGSFIINSDVSSIASAVNQYKNNLTDANLTNGIIDVLNKLSSADLQTISDHYGLADLTYNGSLILSNDTTTGLIDRYNSFLGLNLGNSPSFVMQDAIASKSFILFIAAIIIPILAGLTQWINVKLMPTQSTNEKADPNDQQAQMMQSMKTMNLMMPLFSVFMCYSFPMGVGLYWVAGAVVRTIQQIVINKHIDSIDIDAEIEKNQEKYKKKLEKRKEQTANMMKYANMNTKNISDVTSKNLSETNKSEAVNKAKNVYASGNIRKDSLLARANMVKEYDEKNNNK
ncbi:MAG: YidC/Oxa1 family membrane protein insertase [Butyrivibrio sp.]|nr:YidC/Oxa1 family membrane protein insertase [Butyrivibrio sp.]